MFGCYRLYLARSPLFCAGALFKDVHQIFVMLFASQCRLINGQSELGVPYSCAYPDPNTHSHKESAAPAVFWLREANVAISVRLQLWCWPLFYAQSCRERCIAFHSDCILMEWHIHSSKSIMAARDFCLEMFASWYCFLPSPISLSGNRAVLKYCNPPTPTPTSPFNPLSSHI